MSLWRQKIQFIFLLSFYEVYSPYYSCCFHKYRNNSTFCLRFNKYRFNVYWFYFDRYYNTSPNQGKRRTYPSIQLHNESNGYVATMFSLGIRYRLPQRKSNFYVSQSKRMPWETCNWFCKIVDLPSWGGSRVWPKGVDTKATLMKQDARVSRSHGGLGD